MGIKLHRIRRSSQHSFADERTTKSDQNKKRTPIIHVKTRPKTLNHSLTSKNEVHSASITANTTVFTNSNTQSLKNSAKYDTSGIEDNKSLNSTIASETNIIKDAWSFEAGKESSSDRYNIHDWKTITGKKNKKNNWKRCRCCAGICCQPYLCCFIAAMAAILLLAGIAAALISVLNKQSTTTTTTTIITTETTITTTTSTTQTTSTTTAAPVFLINPDAENGTLYGWTAIGTSPSIDNGTANLGSTPPYSGSYDFYGGPGRSLYQSVSLISMFSTTQLDSGSLYASYSFWERSANQTPPDTAQVTLVFRSATNTVLSNTTLGPQAFVLVWCYRSDNLSLPVGTRSIDYQMTFVANYGSYADAWIDDNELNVA